MQDFVPHALLPHGWLQTIVASWLPQNQCIGVYQRHRIALDDGDALDIALHCPETWDSNQRIIVLVHGLTGSAESSYILRIGQKLYHQGYAVVRANLRGCGSGFGVAKQPYHSGRSEDTRVICRWLTQQYPNAAITQIGFSLGGNITLKMAGEKETAAIPNLDHVIAISPPIHLSQSATHMGKGFNQIFERYFIQRLRKAVAKLHMHFPELGNYPVPKCRSIRDFDEYYTAPRCGFKSAEDYYQQSSSCYKIPSIQIKGQILIARDDPVVDFEAFEHLDLPENMELSVTESGGHLGFLSHHSRGLRWMDEWILEKITKEED